jgi:hypothetical protein
MKVMIMDEVLKMMTSRCKHRLNILVYGGDDFGTPFLMLLGLIYICVTRSRFSRHSNLIRFMDILAQDNSWVKIMICCLSTSNVYNVYGMEQDLGMMVQEVRKP